MKARPWKAIVAADGNRVIGAHGGIPWHFPEDFKWFKACTLGHIVLMGRKTYESLPKRPLPGRANWVLSRDASQIAPAENLRVFGSLEAVRAAAETNERDLWVCGGEGLYRLALPLCDEVYLTRVKQPAPSGDAFLPPFEADFLPPELLRDTPDFSIVKYTRKPSA